METHSELVERIENDVDKLLVMYDLAEKSYSYKNVHGERLDSDQEQRENL